MKKINWNDVDVKTILEMHQKSGYKSSLLNEQAAPGAYFTQTQDIKFLKFGGERITGQNPKGTLWTWDGKVAKDKDGDVFSCKPYKPGHHFTYKGNFYRDLDNVLFKQLAGKFCSKAAQNVKNYYITTKQYCLSDGRCVPSGTRFVSFSPNRIIAYSVKLNNQEKTNVSFYCEGSSNYGDPFAIHFRTGNLYGRNSELEVQLKKVCGTPKYTAQPKQDKVTPKQDKVTPKKDEVTPKKDQGTPNMGTGGKSGVTSQSATITKQIQTLLGNQAPTGTITEPELDTLLTKL